MSAPALRVLFLCTGNSARSQLAEALLRHLSHGRIEALSAGTHPQPEIHPMTRVVLNERYGIDAGALTPKPVGQLAGRRFDVVITVCDGAAETCPLFPDATERLHWRFEDPARVPPGPAQKRAFEAVAKVLVERLHEWMARPEISRRLGGG